MDLEVAAVNSEIIHVEFEVHLVLPLLDETCGRYDQDALK